MSLGTSNRDGGKTSESGHLRALGKIVLGDVMEGLAASQRAAGVNMSVDISTGDAFVRRADGSYAHPVFNDAVYNQVISAADGSNPRRDIVVIYVDYGQAPSTAVSNNTNGVVKIKVVNGTPAGSPVDPNAAAIQASVGSGNPYSILARVRVPAGQTSISNSLIDDLRTMIYDRTNSVPRAAIQNDAVDYTKLAAGTVIQVVSANFSNVLTSTNQIPEDNTIPQNTEGVEVMTLAITPKLATSILLVEVEALMSNSANNCDHIVTLFQDSAANAIAGVIGNYVNTGTAMSVTPLKYRMVAGGVVSTTFRVRIGGNIAGTVTFNGQTGAGKFGGIPLSNMTITEIKA